jgi:D-hydroxyproline dehydrogenase subunit beta
MSRRCVVLGGGVVGVLAGLRLAEAGADVTLVDASVPGSGTSATTFAHVNASYPGYWEYFELRAAGVAGYRRLRSELGSAPWLVDTGFLQVEHSAGARQELAEHAVRLQDAGYPVARVSPQRVRDRLEPELVIGKEVDEVFFFPDEGYVEVHRMLADLLRAGTRLGLDVRQNDRAVGLQVLGAGLRGVTLESGEHLPADVVVCCGGRWTDEVLSLAGVELSLMAPDGPGSIAPGLIVVSEPVLSRLGRVVCIDGMNIRPDGGGRLMLWSGDLDQALQALGAWGLSDPPPALPDELPRHAVEHAARHVPALEGAAVEKAHACVRALPRDGLPVVGWVPQTDGLYVIAAHAAVTMAPILGELAAQEIVESREAPMLERFRPDRFCQPPSLPERERAGATATSRQGDATGVSTGR